MKREAITIAVTGLMVACSNPFATVEADFAEDQFELISPGTFVMGRDSQSTQFPLHDVTISRPFYMQRTEVTQGQWKSVMGSNPSSGHFGGCGDACPVESVSWNDIQEFLAALNVMDPGKGYRLPTEAEWEYAARAGTTGSWGGTGDPSHMSNNGPGRGIHPVAELQPNHWGLYDMHGNVWEWVHDRFEWAYGWRFGDPPLLPITDPSGPATGMERVMRGGSFGNMDNSTTSWTRRGEHPDLRRNWAGFRLARSSGP